MVKKRAGGRGGESRHILDMTKSAVKNKNSNSFRSKRHYPWFNRTVEPETGMKMLLVFLFFIGFLVVTGGSSNFSSDHEHERQHLKSKFLELFRNVILNKQYNDHKAIVDGRDWPPEAKAFSMAGMRRIDHFSAIVAQAISFGIPGHVIETGVWRGEVAGSLLYH